LEGHGGKAEELAILPRSTANDRQSVVMSFLIQKLWHILVMLGSLTLAQELYLKR